MLMIMIDHDKYVMFKRGANARARASRRAAYAYPIRGLGPAFTAMCGVHQLYLG